MSDSFVHSCPPVVRVLQGLVGVPASLVVGIGLCALNVPMPEGVALAASAAIDGRFHPLPLHLRRDVLTALVRKGFTHLMVAPGQMWDSGVEGLEVVEAGGLLDAIVVFKGLTGGVQAGAGEKGGKDKATSKTEAAKDPSPPSTPDTTDAPTAPSTLTPTDVTTQTSTRSTSAPPAPTADGAPSRPPSPTASATGAAESKEGEGTSQKRAAGMQQRKDEEVIVIEDSDDEKEEKKHKEEAARRATHAGGEGEEKEGRGEEEGDKPATQPHTRKSDMPLPAWCRRLVRVHRNRGTWELIS
jgi:hypothetical protein